jgi:hypothetical protein
MLRKYGKKRELLCTLEEKLQRSLTLSHGSTALLALGLLILEGLRSD